MSRRNHPQSSARTKSSHASRPRPAKKPGERSGSSLSNELARVRKDAQNQSTDITYALTRNVCLVGFMGAGKTSVARRLARQYRLSCIDLDRYISGYVQMDIPEFIREEGIESFREVEKICLQELLATGPALISCGGGVITREDSRKLIKEKSFCIHLRVTADEAAARISDLSSRPLFGDIEQARMLAKERLPLYEEVSSLTIRTARKKVPWIAAEIKDELVKQGVLTCQ